MFTVPSHQCQLPLRSLHLMPSLRHTHSTRLLPLKYPQFLLYFLLPFLLHTWMTYHLPESCLVCFPWTLRQTAGCTFEIHGQATYGVETEQDLAMMASVQVEPSFALFWENPENTGREEFNWKRKVRALSSPVSLSARN